MKTEKAVSKDCLKEIEKSLSNYSWMINEIRRIRSLLGDAEKKDMPQSNVGSILPKPQKMASNPISNEVFKGNRTYRRLMELEEKVLCIQNRIHAITDERESAILDCLLDGMRMTDIARHMGLSNTQTHRIRRGIARTIATADPEPISAS